MITPEEWTLANRIAENNNKLKTPAEVISAFERFMADIAESVTELDEEKDDN